MRHIIGSSEPDVIIGSDKDQNKECRKKDKDMEFLCELNEAQGARGRHFVHELTFENVVRGENHGHAMNENDSGGSAHVRIGRMR